jgi:septal ring factor EnvC (AmiA/AmiB activator)
MSQKGPILDKQREIRGYGRVYLCQACVKDGAMKFGFAKGARLDELSTAAASLEEREKEIASLAAQLAEVTMDQTQVLRADQALKEELADAKARISQLEGRIREEAEVNLSLVGGA